MLPCLTLPPVLANVMRCAAQRTSTRLPEFKRMDGGTNARTHAASTRSCTLAFNSLSLLLRAVSKAVENYWNDVLEIITLVLKATKMMGFMVVHYDVKDFETQKVC